MRLEDYWGVGPKTRDLLTEELGVEAAVAAIESGDVRALTDAGLPRGRATRILRRATGGEAMDLLATRDTRAVYRDIVDLAAADALTAHTADRIRVLTPLASREAREERLDSVLDARETWIALDDETRAAVETAFEDYDSVGGGDPAAVEAALALADTGAADGATDGVFAPLAELDADELDEAATALRALAAADDDGGGVGASADDELDALRECLGAVEDLLADIAGTLEAAQSGARTADEFEEAFAAHVVEESGVDRARLRDAIAPDAVDAEAFVAETLRALADDLRSRVDEREREVRADLEATVEDSRGTIDTAATAVDDIALSLSLARFADAFDLSRPGYAAPDAEVLAVENARNLALVDAGESVQPITYAVGDNSLDDVPGGDRVTVLTGANSGGKTTLLETLCQVALLAAMGLPVPAERAEVSPVDAVVFHRRHASFNAGVLESTLRTVVPPLAEGGRALMLVDEFEAITEPGSAADLLHGLVTLTVDRDALGVFVTHLAEDLEPLPEAGRVDGIFARGLTRDLELDVDYQPRFGTLGRSTPEFIVSRLVADSGVRTERAAFEHLAQAVGEEAVQRTLSDAEWAEGA
jgi:hypothetical protein